MLLGDAARSYIFSGRSMASLLVWDAAMIARGHAAARGSARRARRLGESRGSGRAVHPDGAEDDLVVGRPAGERHCKSAAETEAGVGPGAAVAEGQAGVGEIGR